MTMTIKQFATRNVGQRALLDAKIAEFTALSTIGVYTSKSREDAHSILDAHLDGIEDINVAIRRGDFDKMEG